MILPLPLSFTLWLWKIRPSLHLQGFHELCYVPEVQWMSKEIWCECSSVNNPSGFHLHHSKGVQMQKVTKPTSLFCQPITKLCLKHSLRPSLYHVKGNYLLLMQYLLQQKWCNCSCLLYINTKTRSDCHRKSVYTAEIHNFLIETLFNERGEGCIPTCNSTYLIPTRWSPWFFFFFWIKRYESLGRKTI